MLFYGQFCKQLSLNQGAKLGYIPKTEYYELPSKYDKTIVRLLVQSPTRMFVYWQVSDETIREFNQHHKEYGKCIPVLKIKNLTMGYSYDLPVDPFTNNYYIEVKDPDCEYQVELGRKYQEQFVNIYTSNMAKIPRSSPVPINYSEEIMYKNYIRLNLTDKFTVFYKKKTYQDYLANLQGYEELSFANPEDIGTSGVGSFTRYENGISSFHQYEVKK